MSKLSLAKSFFDEIINAQNKIDFLTALAEGASPYFEEQWLEFKCAPNIEADDVKKNWSKALSGFANTGSGLLIWGIKAATDPATKVDRASSTCLVDNPERLKSRLRELQNRAADPPVLGVIVEPFTNAAGKGFVVCLIPESEHRPHRAEYIENKPFYIRAASSFELAPISMLKAMFYPRARPYLRVKVAVHDFVKHNHYLRWEFSLYNTGTATAQYVDVMVRTDAQMQPDLGLGSNPPSGVDWRTGMTYHCDRPIHPGSFCNVFSANEPIGAADARMHSAKFTVYMYAKDHEPQAAEVSFNDHDIVNKDPKDGVPIEFPNILSQNA